MGKNVLIVGSGGANKYDYLEWLTKLGANVILLEPEGKADTSQKTKWTTHYTNFANLNDVINTAMEINSTHPLYTADTIFELTMEHAAEVRKALDLPGLTPEFVRFGRNKTVMAEFMRSNNIRIAPFIIFDKDDDLEKIQEQMAKDGNIEWILKPDNLGANIGVRRVKNANRLIKAFESAQDDIISNPYLSMLYYETDRKWIVCHFIEGNEFETEVCVHRGEVVLSSYLFKTISMERKEGIEENRYITPAPWLTPEQLKDLDNQIQTIGKAVYENVMKPCGKETLVLHPEFRLDKENNAYTLEFAFRNGGGLNPYRIEESTGINPYYLSAAATLGETPDMSNYKIRGASGYQMLFSNRKGTFEGFRGIKEFPGITVKPEEPIGYKISVPHAEVLVSVIASAKTPEEVDRMLNEAVRDAKLIVDGVEVSAPLSKWAE